MISILIPAYIDSEEKLEWFVEALHSCEVQTIEHEVIVFDDASPVDITPVAKEFPNYKFYRFNENKGPSLARNMAAHHAQYDIFVPLDSDDKFSDRDSLATMFQMYELDQTRFIYGNFKRLVPKGDTYAESQEFQLPDYSFDNVKTLRGAMPVTSMFSRSMWEAAGGWKSKYDEGFEDVEFYVSAGRAGYCGTNIKKLVFVYRKHTKSRYAGMKARKLDIQMSRMIQIDHQPIFDGGKIAACAEIESIKTPEPIRQSIRTIDKSPQLSSLDPSLVIYVQYTGNRTGSFGAVGKFSGFEYRIIPGTIFPIHVNDSPQFERSGKGSDFNVNVQPTADVEIEFEKIDLAPTDSYIAPPVEIVQDTDYVEIIAL